MNIIKRLEMHVTQTYCTVQEWCYCANARSSAVHLSTFNPVSNINSIVANGSVSYAAVEEGAAFTELRIFRQRARLVNTTLYTLLKVLALEVSATQLQGNIGRL